MPWKSFTLQLIILYSKEKHLCKWLNMEYLSSYQFSCKKKTISNARTQFLPSEFQFYRQKSLPDDQSTIMQSETFRLSFPSMRNSIILMSIVPGGKTSSVSLENVNDVNVFFNPLMTNVLKFTIFTYNERNKNEFDQYFNFLYFFLIFFKCPF